MSAKTHADSSQRKILLLLLFLTACLVSFFEAYFVDQPGMMDACYYYSGGLNIIRGQGENEYFLWNYLDDSSAIPHPSFQYWMPLPSLVAAIGMFLFGEGFRQSQIPFFILGALFPLMVFWLGQRLSGSFRISILAGFFAAFSGFYTVYWMNTESFLIYAWLGGLIIGLSAQMASPSRWFVPILIGVLCGLAHLTRADGVLFLVPAGLLILADHSLPRTTRGIRILLLGTGYLLTAGIWFVRNITVWGSLFPPGTGKTLWLIEYNDMFYLPSSAIGWERFLSSGVSSVLSARWDAFLSNSVSTIFITGLIFLFPILCWGVFLLRRKAEMRAAVTYYLLIFFLMTVVYPFQGSRGGFLHSSSALLSVAAIAIATGLEDAIARLSRWRNWNLSSAQAFLGAGIVALAGVSSAAIFFSRVIGSDLTRPNWSTRYAAYSLGTAQLPAPLPESARFIVNTTPCFYLRTGFQAIPVPSGGLSMLLEAADQYGIDYVILDANVPDGLVPLYEGDVSDPRLKRIFSVEYGGVTYVWFQVQTPPQENPE